MAQNVTATPFGLTYSRGQFFLFCFSLRGPSWLSSFLFVNYDRSSFYDMPPWQYGISAINLNWIRWHVLFCSVFIGSVQSGSSWRHIEFSANKRGVQYLDTTLFCIPHITWLIKSKRLSWVQRLVRTREMKNVCRVLVGKPEGKTLGRLSGRME
jgi:hypothetical protein